MNRLLIISREEQLIKALEQCLASVQSAGSAVILRQYPSPGPLRGLLQTQRFNAVIVGLGESDRALELIAELRAGHPGMLILAAHTINSSDLILGAIRAGASEYLGPPFEVYCLERALDRRARQEDKATPKGRLIGFIPARAGCGASTIAMHVAAAMSRHSEQRVLLIDFDFHSGTVDFCLRLKPEFTIADALRRGTSMDELWDRLVCRWKGVDVLVRPRDFAVRAENLDRAAAVFTSARRMYPWVIGDLPAALYSSCRDILSQVDVIYIVCTPEPISLHLARSKAQELRALGVSPELIRLIVNRVGSRRAFSVAEVGNTVGIPVAWALRNDYKAVNSASIDGRLVDEESELGRQLLDLAMDVMGARRPVQRAPRVIRRKQFSNGGAEAPRRSIQNVVPPKVNGTTPA